MKKITFLFSLLLLFFTGGLTANAQSWQEDVRLDDVPDEDTPVALFHPGASNDSPARWWAGANANTTEELTDAGLVIFEPTGDWFFDSFLDDDVPTYRLKDYATGKYLKDVRLSDWMDSSDFSGQPVTDWTTNPSEAFTFTVLPGEEGDGANPRALVNSQKQTTGDGEFVLCSTYTYTAGGETVYTYLGAIAQPFLAPWQDTNAWQIFTVSEKGLRDRVVAMLNEYFPNGVDETIYPVGNNPGQYNEDVINQVKAVYDEVSLAIDGEDPISDDTLREYLEALENAHTLLAEQGINQMKPGFYYFRGTNGQYMYADGVSMLYTKEDAVPEIPSADKARYIWEVTAADADANGTPRFYFQNFATKGYASQTKNSGGFYTTTEVATDPVYVTFQQADNRFNLKFEKSSGYMNTFYGWATGSIGEWNSDHDAGSLWHIVALEESDVKAIEEQVEKTKLLEELLSTWTEAEKLYNFGREITALNPDEQEDIEGPDYSTPEGLLVSASQLSCGTNVESTEGSIEGLVDGIIAPSGSFVKDEETQQIILGVDNTHYYHTMWSANPTEEPYIQITLAEPVDAAILKIAKRINAGNQMNKFELYSGSIALTHGGGGGLEWRLEGIYDVTYDKPALGQGLKEDKTAFVDSTWQNATALVGVELTAPTTFIKIVPISVGNQTKGSWGIFNIGELRVYAGMYNEDLSTFEQVDPDVADEFSGAMALALSEINSGEATRETIDRLKAAMEAFNAQLPNPDRLAAAIDEFNNYYSNLPTTSQAPLPAGWFPTTIAKYESSIADVSATMNPLMTRQEIENGIAEVQRLLENLKAEIGMPTVGTYYNIRGRANEVTGYKNVTNAPLYAANNATKDAYDESIEFNKREAIHYMPYKQDGTKADSVNVSNHINYVWVVESADQATQTITLRNVGTGTYFGYIPNEDLSQPIYMSNEPIAIRLQSAHVSTDGFFNLIVGDGLYANGAPSTGNIVKWNSARGNDNSAFDFIEVATLMDNTTLDLTKNEYNIITLPYGISRFYGNGKAYTCLGQNEGDIELKEIANGSAIAAGTPFIYKAAETQTTLNAYIEKDPAGMVVYNMEPLTVNGLVGTLEPVRITTFPAYKLTGVGETSTVTENLYNYNKEIEANRGYFFFDADSQTTETGDVQIPISGYDPTGIETVEVAAQAKDARIYDLSGRRVMKTQKGLYIINGQKVLVK